VFAFRPACRGAGATRGVADTGRAPKAPGIGYAVWAVSCMPRRSKKDPAHTDKDSSAAS